MCSITIIKNSDSVDVYMNRDERLERDPEISPAHYWDNDILAPLDTQSNGTWIAVNTKTKNWGALLNGYTNISPADPIKSRGHILPDLLGCDDPLDALNNMDCTHFTSFKLILNARMFHWDGIKLNEEKFHVENNNVLFQTSSSFEQNKVIKIRKELFNNWVEQDQQKTGDDIPTLHLSRDPDPLRSIMMRRDYSETKSITHLHVSDGVPTMYWLQAVDEF